MAVLGMPDTQFLFLTAYIKEETMEVNETKTFDKCPVCGSTERFFESLVKEMKEKGTASEGFTFSYHSAMGVVIDKATMDSLPYETELPAYALETDICMNCGVVYARKLVRLTATKKVNMSKFLPDIQNIQRKGRNNLGG